jgi:hypothetical protein
VVWAAPQLNNMDFNCLYNSSVGANQAKVNLGTKQGAEINESGFMYINPNQNILPCDVVLLSLICNNFSDSVSLDSDNIFKS